MAGPFTIARRTLPPSIVLFLFVDLVVNPYIPRLGTVAEGTRIEGQLTVDESRALLARSRQLMGAGQYQQALAPALRLYRAYPANYVYSQALAQIYHRLGSYKEESEYWEKFIEQAPLPIEACPDIGQAYWKLGRRDEAIAALERCLTYDPYEHDTLFELAHAREMTADYPQAAAIYRKALEKSPANPDCLLGLARAELRMGRVADARRLDARVLRASPKNPDALLVAGLVAKVSGNPSQARRYLLEGSELSPDYADFQTLLGQIDASQGRYREAAARYGRALQINPGDRDAANGLLALNRRMR